MTYRLYTRLFCALVLSATLLASSASAAAIIQPAGLEHTSMAQLAQSDWGQTAQASQQMEQGRYQTALVTLRSVGQANPKHLLAHYLWAEAAYQQAHQTTSLSEQKALLREARAVFEKTVLLNPRILTATLRLGKLAMDQGDLKGAERYYSHALEVLPNSAILQFNLANVYDEQGDITQAIHHYQQAVTLNPSFTYAYNNMGLLLEQQQETDKAAEAFQAALKIDSGYNFARLNLGQLYLKQGRMADAEAEFQKALTHEPENAWAHIYLGNLHVQQHQYPKAEQSYRMAIQQKPDYAPTYYLLAAVLQKQNQWTESLQFGQAYLKLAPKGQFAAQAKQLVAYVRQQQAQPVARGYISIP